MIPAHTLVGQPDAPKLCFVMHGVLGAGNNLRSLTKGLVASRPEYQFVLIDLRYHGKSLGAPGPHKIASCADDLLDLAAHLNRAPDAVIGHSLGGKVALAYAERHEAPTLSQRAPSMKFHGTLKQVWTLDSDPGAQVPGGAHQVRTVLNALLSHPGPFSSRDEAIQCLLSEGLSSGLANWLATNLGRVGDEVKWRFEMDNIEELLDDYFQLDLWPLIENLPPVSRPPTGNLRYELLLAEKSDRWSGSMKERASALTSHPRVRVHVLADAGHWVHVDNPDGLHRLLVEYLV